MKWPRRSPYARGMRRLGKTVIGATVAAAVAGAGVFPAAAGAATAFVTRTEPDEYAPEGVVRSITYAADPGETNEVTITSDRVSRPRPVVPFRWGNGILHIRDPGAVITAGAGCTAVSLHRVTCGESAPDEAYPDEELIVFAGDGDDFVDATGVAFSSEYNTAPRLDGGDGDDVLLGSDAGSEWLIGGSGNDLLRGGGDGPKGLGDCYICGQNNLVGGPGDDRLVGGPGQDVLSGGEGADILDGRGGTRDEADYGDSPGPVVVTLDDRLGNGRAGENDHIRNVEWVYGSKFGDRLVGNAGANRLYGQRGADVLSGRRGNDWLHGGAGGDVLRPGAGRDRVEGWQGRDRIYARDGARDRLDGGEGRDRARIDRGLDRVRGIERLF